MSAWLGVCLYEALRQRGEGDSGKFRSMGCRPGDFLVP